MISSFQILGQTIEVIIDNEYCHKNKCYGQFIPFENKIIIANKFKSKNVIELGGGSGKLATEYLKSNEKSKWTIYDKNYSGLSHKKSKDRTKMV